MSGQWIVQNSSFIYSDMFSYTHSGVEWVNVKWGFEVLIYGLSRIGGPELIPVLQAVVAVVLVWLSRKSAGLFFNSFRGEKSKFPDSAALLAILLLLIGIEFRMISRPEMVSHLFTAVFLFYLLRYRDTPDNRIYWLILYQIIWTNFHEAFGIGIVILIAFTVGCWLEYLYGKYKVSSNPFQLPKVLSLVTALSILGISINPYGPRQILHPFNIFGQLKQNKFTTELVSFNHPLYWNWEAYLAIGVFALCLIGLFLIRTNKQRRLLDFSRLVEKPGLGYLFLFGLFSYLGLTAYRNIPFFLIVSFPMFVLCLPWVSANLLSGLSLWRKWFANQSAPAYAAILVISLALWVSAGTGFYYNSLEKRDNYGLKIDVLKNPTGAANFIQRHNIEGLCFSDYLTSSYLLWHLQPDFRTYIDLRDLDVFEPEFFEEFFGAVASPGIFQKIDQEYQFDYIVLYRKQFYELHAFLANASDYELVYADVVAAVYVRKGDRFASLIDEYGYQLGERDVFVNSIPNTSGTLANILNFVVWPLYQADDFSSVDFDLYASEFYRSVQNYAMAEQRAERSLANGLQPSRSYEMLGNIYLDIGRHPGQSQANIDKFIPLADEHFQLALDEDPNAELALIGKGIIEFEAGDITGALVYFEKAYNLNKRSIDVTQNLTQCYDAIYNNVSSSEENGEKWLFHQKRLASFLPNNPIVQYHLGRAYFSNGKCNSAKDAFLKAIESGVLSQQQVDYANSCMKECN